MKRVIFHPGAIKEYVSAADYFTGIQPELAVKFSVEIDAAIGSILEAPERWPVIEEDVHRYLAHTFPYAVLYTIEPDHVYIIAVMHTAREPSYWRNRL